MSDNSGLQLESISRVLLDPESSFGSLRQACQDFFALGEAVTGIGEQGANAAQKTPVELAHGRAISPLNAARCAREFARTTQFVRGVHAALQEARQLFPGQVIHTLYAGCGPYATLILPLLAVLPREAFRFTLVDVQPLALQSAQKLIGHFGFDGFIREYALFDASGTELAAMQPFHVAITETLNQAMAKEPQLAVSANLAKYLEPGGILLPECITVKAALIDSRREMTLFPAEHQGEMQPLPRRRLELGTLMSLDLAELKPLRLQEYGEHLPPITLEWPDQSVRGDMRLGLLTHIRVFGPHCLGCYDCSLTIPKYLRLSEPAGQAANLEFRYRLGSYPGFDYRWV